MLYIVGLGLGDAKDISVKGLEIIRMCNRVYLESYTSVLTCGKNELEKFYARSIIEADRDMVEGGAAEVILKDADKVDVAFLVVGDPFGATTHIDLLLRARELNIPTMSIHNASIMNAIGCTGLQLYNFGETVSIPFWDEGWQPDSFYDKIVCNHNRGLHTLCLLDIKTKERTIENMMRGKNVFEPPKFMKVAVAADQLLKIIRKRVENVETPSLNEDILCVAVARLGSDDQKIVSAKLSQLPNIDMGPPLHSLVIVGHLHPLEAEFLRTCS